VRERAMTRLSIFAAAAVDRRLAEQHDVASRQIHISSGVWYAGGVPAIAQWGGGVDVLHIDAERDERAHPALRFASARKLETTARSEDYQASPTLT